MKKCMTVLLAGAAAAAALLTACQDKNQGYILNVPKTVDVVSGADIAFKAIGGEGDIEVAPVEGTLTATTAQSWCHLTVNGTRIHVKTDPYTGLESRYAKVEMKAGDATGVTIVHQYGIIVRTFSPADVTVKNPAQDVTFYYDANETMIEASADADWLTAIAEKDSLRIRISENVSKEYREASVRWNIGEMKGTFSVVQFDMAEAGLLGKWNMHGMGGSGFRTPYDLEGTLAETDDGSYTFRLVLQTMDVTFRNVRLDRNRLLLPLGDCIGKRNDYFVFPLFGNGTTTVMYENATTTGALPMVLAKQEDGHWHADADVSGFEGNFRFEMWRTEDHEGNSATRLMLRDIYMDKLED